VDKSGAQLSESLEKTRGPDVCPRNNLECFLALRQWLNFYAIQPILTGDVRSTSIPQTQEYAPFILCLSRLILHLIEEAGI
jgi:hypothetical protein